ncbi:MAG: hypothetical protein LBL09_01550 [Oscillospiraceae bacterium]|nr:hypothetical protein [Oscillospiraceae bacterium]
MSDSRSNDLESDIPGCCADPVAQKPTLDLQTLITTLLYSGASAPTKNIPVGGVTMLKYLFDSRCAQW